MSSKVKACSRCRVLLTARDVQVVHKGKRYCWACSRKVILNLLVGVLMLCVGQVAFAHHDIEHREIPLNTPTELKVEIVACKEEKVANAIMDSYNQFGLEGLAYAISMVTTPMPDGTPPPCFMATGRLLPLQLLRKGENPNISDIPVTMLLALMDSIGNHLVYAVLVGLEVVPEDADTEKYNRADRFI